MLKYCCVDVAVFCYSPLKSGSGSIGAGAVIAPVLGRIGAKLDLPLEVGSKAAASDFVFALAPAP